MLSMSSLSTMKSMLNPKIPLAGDQKLSPFYIFMIGIPFAILVFYNNLTWLINYCEILLWRLLFRKILKTYFENVETRNVLENIRNFHTLTRFFESFNEIYGVNLLIGLVSCSIVSSLYIWNLLSTDANGGGSIIYKIAMVTSILLYGLNLIIASEINTNARIITFALKSRLSLSQHYWQPEENYHQEFIIGFILILHDLESNAIGFRGFRFFTITYQFVAAILSVVPSYSIIILQFQLTADQVTSGTVQPTNPTIPIQLAGHAQHEGI